MQLVSSPPPATTFDHHYPTISSPSATATALADATSRWRSTTARDNAALEVSRFRVNTVIAQLRDTDAVISGALRASTVLR